MKKLSLKQASKDELGVVNKQGKTLAVYHYGHDQKHPYFHPLHSQASCEPLTCFAPYDHPWHKGLWWSWKYINGVLFWEHNPPPGHDEGDSLVVAHQAREKDEGVLIEQTLEMRTLKSRDLLMTERRELRLLPEIPGWPEAWGIDWAATFRAEVDCDLVVTPFPEMRWGGYAGLNYRPSRTLAFAESIVQAEGARGTDDCHGRKARWAAYGGVLDGDATASVSAPRRAAVAMFDHPSNDRHPTPWYHWSSGENNRGFGFMAASFLMHGNRKLNKGEELSLRYRVVILDGAIEPARLDAAWTQWSR